jgi:Na+/H+ antiporter NhaD/arsenite permease-like protein
MADTTRLAATLLIVAASFLVFSLGRFPGMTIDRPSMAIIGAVALVAIRAVPSAQILPAIDFSTVVLLFSIMVIAANLRLSGFFGWFTEWLLVRLHPRHLLPTVIFVSGILSAFLMNDVVCLVLTPIVIELARRQGQAPLPFLLALATASNIGSVATVTGNPQNMLIGVYSGIPYREFLTHLAPVAIVGLLLDWAVILVVFGADTEAVRVDVVRATGAIQPRLLVKSLLVTCGVFAGFLGGLPMAPVAVTGAALLLVTRTVEPKTVYEQIDWSLLVFFVGLFVIVRAIETSGLAATLIELARRSNLHNVVALTVVTATLSNIVSNVPAVMLLKSVMPTLEASHRSWLTMAMASTLAGNLTITGSIANMIVIERARHEAHVSVRDYLRVGVPVTIITVIVGALWLWATVPP